MAAFLSDFVETQFMPNMQAEAYYQMGELLMNTQPMDSLRAELGTSRAPLASTRSSARSSSTSWCCPCSTEAMLEHILAKLQER